MLVNRIFSRRVANESTIPEPYVWATDADFSGTTNGSFIYIGAKQYVAIPNEIKGVNVTSYASMFQHTTIIKGIINYSKSITDMSNMFYNCPSLTSLDLSSFDTSNVTNMSNMFRDCPNITSLDLSSFDTSNVTDMSYMFRYCSSLTSLDLSSFDTSNVTNMSNMFRDCPNITNAYARTQADADKLNASSNKPTTWSFVVKP